MLCFLIKWNKGHRNQAVPCFDTHLIAFNSTFIYSIFLSHYVLYCSICSYFLGVFLSTVLYSTLVCYVKCSILFFLSKLIDNTKYRVQYSAVQCISWLLVSQSPLEPNFGTLCCI